MNQEANIDSIVIESLNALPLFSSQELSVTRITKGLSSDCYLVSFPASQHIENDCFSPKIAPSIPNNDPLGVTRYFVKSLFNNGKELNEDIVELEAIGYASAITITPEVAYIDQDWLIQPFVKGTNLENSHIRSSEKISVVLTLLLKCHDISFAAACHREPTLKTSVLPFIDERFLYEMIFSELKRLEGACIKNSKDSVLTDKCILANSDGQQLISQVAPKLLRQISNWLNVHIHKSEPDDKLDTKSFVFCHGDANFSNIIVTDAGTETGNYLVDFECAVWAEREYDLAMLIAINEIAPSQTASIIKQYKALGGNEVSVAKVTRYLPYCLTLNALWFIDKAFQNPCNKALLAKAQRQLEKLIVS